jgi:hypothetical protein
MINLVLSSLFLNNIKLGFEFLLTFSFAFFGAEKVFSLTQRIIIVLKSNRRTCVTYVTQL